MPPRTVVALATDGVDLLDLTGPLEVFGAATRLLAGRRAGYRTLIAAPGPGPLTCAGGVRLLADVGWSQLDRPVDTLLVAGALDDALDDAPDDGPSGPTARVDSELVGWLRAGGVPARRIVSICAGAHVLAAAGLLDGRRATTHWATAADLAATFPQITVTPDAIFVQDGPVWTSAGVSAGIDLALALVAADHGEKVARAVARWLVVYLKRPGGQSQFSTPLAVDPARRPSIRRLQEWLPGHLEGDLSVTVLAARAGSSVRHFGRLFRAEVGVTPAEYVEALRVEAAARRLMECDEPLPATARACGFGSVESLHRAFRTRLGVSPAAYRSRFRLPSGAG